MISVIMKRKVNLVGQNTLTVSLPSKWVEKNNIKKGDEVEVVEEEKSLIITTSNKKECKEVTLDISNYGHMVGRVVGAVYKIGYDRIKFTYENEDTFKAVQKELTKGFIGLDIINHAKGYCVLESMAAIQPEEFDNAFRRLFRLLIDNATESLDAATSKDYEELELVASKDANVNKFSDFSRRLLNKFGYSNPEKTGLVYFVAEDLENIGDDYRDMCKFIAKNKLALPKKLAIIYEQVNKFLTQFYELFYDFSEQKYVDFGDTYKQLIKDIELQYDSLKNKELVILLKLQSICTSIFDLNGPLITLKL
jgi:phosphate uptake regulator